MKKICLSIVLLFSMLFLFGCDSKGSSAEENYETKKSLMYISLDNQDFFSLDVIMYNRTDTNYYFSITLVPNTYKYNIKDDYYVGIQILTFLSGAIDETLDYFTKDHLTVYCTSQKEKPTFKIKYLVNYRVNDVQDTIISLN